MFELLKNIEILKCCALFFVFLTFLSNVLCIIYSLKKKIGKIKLKDGLKVTETQYRYNKKSIVENREIFINNSKLKNIFNGSYRDSKSNIIRIIGATGSGKTTFAYAIMKHEIGIKNLVDFLADREICESCDWNMITKETYNVNRKKIIIMCYCEQVDYHFFRDLVATLGKSNVIFIDIEENKENDKLIQTMIPRLKIEEVTKVGTYLMPFLYFKKNYINKDLKCCLVLLGLFDSKKSILANIIYLDEKSNFKIQKDTLEILCMLDECIVKRYLYCFFINLKLRNRVKFSIYISNILNGIYLNNYIKKRICKKDKMNIGCYCNQHRFYPGDSITIENFKGNKRNKSYVYLVLIVIIFFLTILTLFKKY